MASEPTSISAHGQGVTKLAFAKSGRKIYTAGDDCLVRIWNPDGGVDQEPLTATEAQGSVGALDTSRGGWVAGGDDSMVRQYSGESDEMVASVAQTGGMPVRCVAFNPQGDKLVVGSDELTAKIIDMHDTLKTSILVGHTRGLRAATWHPSGSYLTTSGQEGKIIVWDCTDGSPKLLHEIDGLILSCSDSSKPEFSYSVAAVWHPTGNYFVVATKAHDIARVSRNDWKRTGSFGSDAHSSDIVALSFSSNGLYLASAGKDGQVIVWDTASEKTVARYKVSTSIVDIAWSPISNLLAWTDMEGALVRWTNPIPSNLPSPCSPPGRSSGVSKSKPPKDKAAHKELMALLAEEGDGSDKEEGEDLALTKDADEEEEDWVEDDMGGDYVKEEKEHFHEAGAREMVNVTKAQPPFQPGATPFKNKRRLLAFNQIGVVEVSDGDPHQVVNVEFHNRSLRTGYHFTDTLRFTLAAIGERGVAFAGPSEEHHPATLSYRPYESWASNADWEINLPAGEEPVAVAAGGLPYSKDFNSDDLGGDGYVALATSEQLIRFFSGGGVQKYIWAAEGDVVSMVAGPEWVFVVHREGGTSLDGCQNLRYSLISCKTFDMVREGRLPLQRNRTVTWIGITEEGAPAMYDSAGYMYILDRFRRPTQGRWVLLMNTNLLARKVGKEETYWPVGLSTKEFLCIILKGRDRYPGFPRPITQQIEVQMPLLSMDLPRVQHEERFLRDKMALTMEQDASHDESASSTTAKEVALDKILIQQIQQACKDDRMTRAIDLAEDLHHVKSIEAAKSVAGFYHKVGLQDKIDVLKERKESGDEEEGDVDPREGWGRVTAPIARSYLPNGAGGRPSNATAFSKDFAPSAAPIRHSLALAKPIGEVPFTANRSKLTGAASTSVIAPSVESSMEVDADSYSFSTDMDFGPSSSSSFVGNGKRKRDEETVNGDEDDGSSEWGASGPSAKRKSNGATTMATNTVAPGQAPPAAKTSANPFARKPGNPFASKPGGPVNPTTGKTVTKSNSFFAKVDAAEADAANGKKGKPKPKEGMAKAKQTTLFNLPPPSSKGTTAKPARAGGKGKAKAGVTESQDEMASVMSTATNLFEDSQLGAEGESQVDGDGKVLVPSTQQETQEEDSQMDDGDGGPASPEWDPAELDSDNEEQVAGEVAA
ncbi:hypothetical protein FS837_011177 [Tulasnella sp. UAMH 9824]|nr:hypothetical protein FS837_011177 [Tulasnella sp. UAMH 9824]